MQALLPSRKWETGIQGNKPDARQQTLGIKYRIQRDVNLPQVEIPNSDQTANPNSDKRAVVAPLDRPLFEGKKVDLWGRLYLRISYGETDRHKSFCLYQIIKFCNTGVFWAIIQNLGGKPNIAVSFWHPPPPINQLRKIVSGRCNISFKCMMWWIFRCFA